MKAPYRGSQATEEAVHDSVRIQAEHHTGEESPSVGDPISPQLTTIFFEKRDSSFTWASVKAVPELAMTLWKPAAKTAMQSI